MQVAGRRSWVAGRLPAIACVLLTAGAAHDPRLTTHDVHVTLTRMAVDTNTIVARMRLFKDDIEAGLKRANKLATLDLRNSTAGDSLFTEYLGAHMWIEADGTRLRGVVRGSGVEMDEQGQAAVWFLVEYPVSRAPRVLNVRDELLFEMFENQQNIVNLLRMPGQQRYSMYFVAGSGKPQTITFE